MGSARRRKGGRATRPCSLGPRDAETVSLINELLSSTPVDIVQLRKLAAIRGLVNDKLRARVWPLLLGVGPWSALEPEEYAALSCREHKDSTVVDCDVARSLWHQTRGWSEESRQRQRAALHRLLTACVGGSDGAVRYYQGLHDVAAVLLFVVGEQGALPLLQHICQQNLRDATRPTLEPVVELLHLLFPILAQADPELWAHIQGHGIPPFFALSWFITWFAHNVESQAQIARLFDLFLASHPLMPLYVAAVAMRDQRDKLLCCLDPSELHHALSTLPILSPGHLSADQLAEQAALLYRTVPPARLCRAAAGGLRQSVAAAAYKSQGLWRVPEEPPPSSGAFAASTVSQLQHLFFPQPSKRILRPKGRVMAVLATATTLAAVGAAVLLGQIQQDRVLHAQLWG